MKPWEAFSGELHDEDATTPVVVVAGLDPVAQEAAVMSAQWDLGGAAVVRVELSVELGYVRTVISDASGVVEDVSVELEHACLTCAIRESLIPTLVRLHGAQRWDSFVVALPTSCEPMPMALGIANAVVDGKPAHESLHLASIVVTVTAPSLEDAVFGGRNLAGLGLGRADDRTYAEAFTSQVEIADVLVLVRSYGATDRALLDHLRRDGSSVVEATSDLCGAALVNGPRDAYEVCSCVDPRLRRASGAPDAEGLVTRELSTWKPMHPARLADSWEALSAGDLRGRGAFWVPGRPETAVAWDCCGGRLAMGPIGGWHHAERSSRWIVTGQPDDVARAAAAFEAAVMTDAELVAAQSQWLGRPDGLEEWLGEVDSAA